MKHPVVTDLEARVLSRLVDHAEALRHEFPDIRIEVWSSPVGALARHPGHDIGIDCRIPDVPRDRPDNVALIIDVEHLTTAPMLDGAMVLWGAPSGLVEIDLFDGERMPYSESTVCIVEERLGELIAALRKALRRGAPTESPGS